VARLNRKRPDLYLMPLKDGQPLAELYTLKKDQLVPASTRGLYLAESFARQEGWVVAMSGCAGRIASRAAEKRKPETHLQLWRQGASVAERARTSHK
jgi:hypothetical protein